MEVYEARTRFEPPRTDGSHNVLSFSKGDRLEVLQKPEAGGDWWVGRVPDTDRVGYVPARYMKFLERKVGRLLTDDTGGHERSMKKLAEMQSSADHKHPDQMYSGLILEPDYDVDDDETTPCTDNNDNLYTEVPLVTPYDQWTKSKQLKDAMYPDIPEPDYGDEGEGLPLMKTMPLSRVSSDRSQHSRTISEPGKPTGLIEPKKLPNPCLDSKERLALNREIRLNSKRGVDILQKSELEKKFERRRESTRQQERETEKNEKRSSLEVSLRKQADKISEYEKQEEIKQKTIVEEEGNEFIKVHHKIRARSLTDSDSS